jgi:hypothetical protein
VGKGVHRREGAHKRRLRGPKQRARVSVSEWASESVAQKTREGTQD